MKKSIALTIGILSTALIAGCGMVAPSPKADAYFMLFPAHTTSADVPVEKQVGLLMLPQVFQTQDDCYKALKEATASTDTPEGKKWLADHQVDKLTAICVPVKF